MAPAKNIERSVTRTYRTAIRLGEDFITLEETITLPIDASDDEVQQAVDLGWRIYRTQREAVEGQVTGIREAQGLPASITIRDPEAPASDKQRNYIAALQEDLTWTNEQLNAFAQEHGVEFVTLTKGQASGFIDNLKKLAEERTAYTANGTRAPAQGEEARAAGGAHPITERQHQALIKMSQDRDIDLDAETQQRFGVPATELTSEQASTLITEWQRSGRAGNRRTVSDTAL
jgi:hypothetical protein